MPSVKDQRMNDIADYGQRTCWPCMRCLARYADGQLFLQGHPGCTFSDISDANENKLLWKSLFVKDQAGKKWLFVRCALCLEAGQDCFAVSTRPIYWR
jgi:hypothetical protein